MKKIILIVIVIALQNIAYAKNSTNLCERIRKIGKEAKALYTDFNDPKSAFILLRGSEFSRIIYQKAKCMSLDDYLKYINQYGLYLTKATDFFTSERFLENIIKKYPENIPMYLYLGNIYKRMLVDRKMPQYREKAIKMYKKYIALSKKKGLHIEKDILDFLKNGGLQKINQTWGKYLNPQNSIPTNKFKAFYINTNTPKNIVATEIVDRISVNYPYNEFHNIDSKDFGAYWVGNLTFKKDTKMQINISQSWAKTRVIIDNLLVYEGGRNAKIPFVFKQGKHKIEVEYINNWHTTDFSVAITPFQKLYNLNELKNKLSLSKDYNIWYVGIYESRNKDHSVEVTLNKSDKPIVLLLQSYETTIWKIKNDYKNKIEAIIVGHSKPGTQVVSNLQKDMVYYVNFKLGSDDLYPKCSCDGAIFHCEGGSIVNTNKRILPLLNKKVDGFNGEYGTKGLIVPNLILNKKIYAEIKQKIDNIKKLKEECSKKTNPNFNNLFK